MTLRKLALDGDSVATTDELAEVLGSYPPGTDLRLGEGDGFVMLREIRSGGSLVVSLVEDTDIDILDPGDGVVDDSDEYDVENGGTLTIVIG